MPDIINVFVLDDHADVRQALVARLRAVTGICVVGDAGEAEPGLLDIRGLRPHVALVETKRADGRGLEIVNWIANSGLETCVIVLTSYPTDWEKWAAYRAGAARYLLKDVGSPQLIREIRKVAAARHNANGDQD